MKELITFLSELLSNVALVLHGTSSERRNKEQTEELSLLYVALKILANAKNIEQVKDAIGFFIESLDFTIDGLGIDFGNVIELEKQATKEMECLANDKVNLAKTLTETQVELGTARHELAKSREENENLRQALFLLKKDQKNYPPKSYGKTLSSD